MKDELQELIEAAMAGEGALTRFAVRVPNNRQVTFPPEVEPGNVELVVLRRDVQPGRRRTTSSKSRQHPAFGMWATNKGTTDSVAFVQELRQRIMERRPRRRTER